MSSTRRQFIGSVATTLLASRARADDATPSDGFIRFTAQTGLLRLRPEPGGETPVWTINGSTPAPLLRLKKGDELRLRVVNALSQPISLHFQGLRIPSAMDGVAGLSQEPIAPGASFDYRFTPPDSGFFWWRPGVAAFAAEQRARGLYGLLIVDEAAPPAVDLDLPAAIDDWKLDESDQIAGPFRDAAAATGGGRAGDIITVNANAIPLHCEQRPGARVRLRLLNACNARLLATVFDGVRPFVLAVDGQPSDPFEPLRATLPFAPGARFDVMFDLPREAGARAAIVLRGGGLRTDRGGEADRDLIVFDIAGEPHRPKPDIAGLPLNPLLPPEIHLEKALRYDLTIDGPGGDPGRAWSLSGGRRGGGDGPLFRVARGRPVALGVINKTPVPQNLHIHGHVMRLLHPLDDGWEPYWRDAVIAPPGKTAHVAFLADNPGKWLIDSTVLEYAANGARAWFEVD